MVTTSVMTNGQTWWTDSPKHNVFTEIVEWRKHPVDFYLMTTSKSRDTKTSAKNQKSGPDKL